MSYAVIQDVPASWEHYGALAEAIGNPVPDGLVFHVAGPTDEGFRTIDVWESEDAWKRFRDATPPGPLHAQPVLRVLRPLNIVRGAPS